MTRAPWLLSTGGVHLAERGYADDIHGGEVYVCAPCIEKYDIDPENPLSLGTASRVDGPKSVSGTSIKLDCLTGF